MVCVPANEIVQKETKMSDYYESLISKRSEMVVQSGQLGVIAPGFSRQDLKSIDERIRIVRKALHEKYAYQNCSIAETIDKMVFRGYTKFEIIPRGKRSFSIRMVKHDGEYFPIFDATGMAYAKEVYGKNNTQSSGSV